MKPQILSQIKHLDGTLTLKVQYKNGTYKYTLEHDDICHFSRVQNKIGWLSRTKQKGIKQ